MTGSSALPGSDLVRRGVADLRARVESDEALLVSIGAPRLRALGEPLDTAIPDPEARLYSRLAAAHGGGAHSRFNALVRRLVSYERALASTRDA